MVIMAAVDQSEQRRKRVEKGHSLAPTRDEERHGVYRLDESEFRRFERTSGEQVGEIIDRADLKTAATEAVGQAMENDAGRQAVGLAVRPGVTVTEGV